MQTIEELAINIGLFYIAIVLGYLVTRMSNKSESLSKLLTTLLINLLLPLLIFGTLLSESGVAVVAELPLIVLLTIICHLASFALLFIILSRREIERGKKGAMLLCVTFNNAIFIPIPLAMMFIGQGGVSVIIMWSLTQIPLMATFGAFLGAFYSRNETSYSSMVKKTLIFPPFIVAILALILISIGFTLPEPVQSALSINGTITTYLALFVVGLELGRRFSLTEMRDALEVFAVRQVIVPLMIFVFLIILGLSKVTSQVILLEAMMPPAVLTVVFAANFELDSETAATIVTVGTLLLLPLVIFLPLILG